MEFDYFFSHKVGPIGNRHIRDHILCNFHATHPYLIDVANLLMLWSLMSLVIVMINEDRFNPVLA